MDNIKELTDFYMWMVENDYDHNIRLRVEKKAEMYLKESNNNLRYDINFLVNFVNKFTDIEITKEMVEEELKL